MCLELENAKLRNYQWNFVDISLHPYLNAQIYSNSTVLVQIWISLEFEQHSECINITLNYLNNVHINRFVYQKALIRTFHKTFVNSQHYNTNSKGDFALNNQF